MKKVTKYRTKGLIIIAASLIFNFLETWFFGRHLHAQTTAEGFADLISSVGVFIGLFLIAGYVTGTMIIDWLDLELKDI